MNREAAILVVYASTHGQTAKIAAKIAEAMRSEGREVDLREAGAAPDPSDYGAVVAGGSLHREEHQPELVAWAKANASELNRLPSALFSVSLTAAEDSDEAREATTQCIERFVEDTGWSPAEKVAIAGALQYLEYDRFTRMLMRLMMKRGGHPTDASRDYDYTDWEAVAALGRKWASLPSA